MRLSDLLIQLHDPRCISSKIVLIFNKSVMVFICIDKKCASLC